MQFVPVPLVSLIRPTFCPVTLPQSNHFFIVVFSLSLAAGFKNYCLTLTFNELSPC